MKAMKKINTIGLYIENESFDENCILDAFFSDWVKKPYEEDEPEEQPYDTIKVVLNCNCTIWAENMGDVPFARDNRNNAVVFYKNGQPVRLLVCDMFTDIEKYVLEVINLTKVNGRMFYDLVDIYVTDLEEKLENLSCFNNYGKSVVSCENIKKFNNTLAETHIDELDPVFKYLPDARVHLRLRTDEEDFTIDHTGVLVCDVVFEKKLIAIQNGFEIDQEKIKQLVQE